MYLYYWFILFIFIHVWFPDISMICILTLNLWQLFITKLFIFIHIYTFIRLIYFIYIYMFIQLIYFAYRVLSLGAFFPSGVAVHNRPRWRMISVHCYCCYVTRRRPPFRAWVCFQRLQQTRPQRLTAQRSAWFFMILKDNFTYLDNFSSIQIWKDG